MMGIVVRGDNLKSRLRIVKRLTCLLLAGFLCISTAVVPFAQALPESAQAPAVTVVSTDVPQTGDIIQSVSTDGQTPVPSEPAVTDSPAVTEALPAVTSIPEASGDIPSEPVSSDIPAVTDAPDVTDQPLTDVTDPTVSGEPSDSDVTDVTDITDITDITDATDITDITDTTDTTDITDDSGDVTSDILDILDEEIDPNDSFVDENGVMFFTLSRGSNGLVTWKVAVNSSGYYTLFVEGNGEVPSDILSQPDVAAYIDKLTGIKVGNGITAIREDAFRGLPHLAEVRFDENYTLTHIYNGAFADCPLLRTVNLESCKALTCIGNTDPVHTTGGGSESANELRATGAFNNSGLTSIVIPASLQQLGHCTFYNCTSLTDVYFEMNSQEFTFGADVFENCTALRNINLEALRGNIITRKIDTLEKYYQGLFYQCDSLESITVPAGFGYNNSPLVAMFHDCNNLKSITFEENHNITGKNNQIDNIISGWSRSIEILDLRNLTALTEIGNYNIRGDKLSIVYLPASVETLGVQPFGDCHMLTAVVFPEGSNLKTIGSESFIRDENLVSVNLENTKVETIGSSAFRNDSALTEISFPATLKTINGHAFENCTSLIRINYNAANLSYVENSAFNGVTSKINVDFGKDVQTIHESFLSALNGHTGEFTFAPDSSFTVVGYASGNLANYDTPFKTAGTYSTDANGNLYKVEGTNKTLIMASKDSTGTFTVPADVTSIGTYAFKGCSGITAIEFANLSAIKSVEDYAFANCENLSALTAGGTALTEEQKTALKNNCTNPDTLFVNTKISGSSSGDGIGGQLQNDKYTFQEINLSADKYTDTLLTGQTWTVHVGVSNGNNDNIYRLYVKCEDGCELTPLHEITHSGPEPTAVPNIYYYEIENDTGETVQFKIPIKYPDGTAPGKKVQVWAVQVNEASLGNLANGVVYPGSGSADGVTADGRYLQMEWQTVPYKHNVTKTQNTGAIPSFTIKNGQPTLTNLHYNIDITFAAHDTAAQGSDDSIAAEYRDVITLPSELAWRVGLQDAIAKGAYNYTIKSEGDNKIATLYATIGGREYNVCSVIVDSAASLNLTGLRLEWNGTAPVIIWQVKSNNQGQLPNLKAHLNIGDVIVGSEGFDTLENNAVLTINNTVDTRVSHQFSADDYSQSQCPVTVVKSPARLSLSKEMLNIPERLGEDVKYRITLENKTSVAATASQLADTSNGGALVVHDGLYAKEGTQLQLQYIKPENIVKLLEAEDGELLKLVISNATLTDMNIDGSLTTVETVDGEETQILAPSNTANVTNNYSVAFKEGASLDTERDDRHTCKDDANVITKAAVITIQKDGADIKVTVTDGGNKNGVYSTASGQTLKQILDSVGYIVTQKTQYDLTWTYPADYRFEAGQSKVIEYTATVKNTFMYTPFDKHYFYNYNAENDTIEVFNHAEIQNPADVYTESSAEVSAKNIQKDLEIYKGYFVNGVEHTNDNEFAIANGDELEYSLNIVHSGSSSYDVLPCVDSMVGPQVLLAEVEKNPHLANRGLPTYKYKSNGNEIECYVLNVKGRYDNVWLGDYCADSVTVTDPDVGEEAGLKTIIKCYFKDTIPSDFLMKVRYKVLVSIEYSGTPKPAEGTTYKTYKLDNTVWLNDHPEHRIYDYIGMPVSVTEFKKIAIKKNDNPLPIEQQSGCPVGKGNKITYRFEFSIRGNAEYILNNESIYDVLPETGGVFAWTKDNVKISYGSNGKKHPTTGSELTNIVFNTTDLIAAEPDGSEWKIETVEGRQQIRWNEGFKITIGNPGDDFDIENERTAYIYVTLTFPSEDATWESYFNGIDSKTVINTLYCDGLPSSVTHTLSGSCTAFIQKGVYETGSFSIRDAYREKKSYYRGSDRLHYATNSAQNKELTENYVTYYVVIANTGSTNLYLAPIYDVLPEGFEFYSLCSTTADNGSGAYVGNKDARTNVQCMWGGFGEIGNALITGFDDPGITYINNTIEISDTSKRINNRQVLKINIIDGYWDYEKVSVDKQGRKFLAPGRAIQFGITCKTPSERVDPAENIVVMEYLNYTESELFVDNTTVANVSTYNNLAPNDGSREAYTDAELTELIGGQLDHVQTGDNIQWLASSVNVIPGDIKPGIEKTVRKQLYKISSGNIEDEDGVVWTVTSHNAGTEGISNYKIVDTLDYPLRFEGAFRYQVEFYNDPIYAAGDMDGKKWVMMGNSYYNSQNLKPTDGQGRWMNLFTIERNDTDNSMKIWSNKLTSGGAKDESIAITLQPNQSRNLPVRLMYRSEGHVEDRTINIEFKVTPVTDSEGNTRNQETLIVTFADDVFTIVPNGKSVFEISSRMDPKVITQDKIGTFNNTAVLVPTQEFANTDQHGELTDYQGNRAVESSAQITTYADSPTTSVKKIEEVGNQNNSGLSTTPSRNRIYVDSSEKQVKYTLTVTNGDAAQPMSKLVIIDNLPEIGDNMTIAKNMARNSEFMVSLADEPNFVVTVTSTVGETVTTTTLTPSEYTVQYCKDSNFARTEISDSDDWRGVDNGKWSTDPTGACSFRVVITKEIKAGDRVDISFNAKLDESAKPGQIAWNSFGYCFETKVSSQSNSTWLYAAPKVVGVGLPELPDIQKRCVVKLNGTVSDYNVKSAETFNFFIFAGDLPTLTDYSAEAIKTVLNGANVKYAEFSITVEAGQSLSEKLSLADITVPADWRWLINTKYTIIEAASPDYINQPVVHTFTYQRDRHDNITVENLHGKSIQITKVNKTDGSVLSGAVFGLYSSDVSDKMSDLDIASYSTQYSLTIENVKTVEMDGKTYYLSKIAATGEDGKITFGYLEREDYLIKELKAPHGYYIIPAQSVQTCDLTSVDSIETTIENRKAAIMPATGGQGIDGIVALGALITVIGAGLFVLLLCRRIITRNM